MQFNDLQSFLKHIDGTAELAKVKVSVDPYLEIAGIVDQVCKSAGDKRALLFENAVGSRIPLVANLFGTQKRVAKALGVDDIEELASRLRSDLKTCKAVNADKALAQLARHGAIEVIPTDGAPCFKRNVTDEGLDALPALHSWPGDGGRYLTLGQVFTRHPGSGEQNCGMYRVQILDKQMALIRCHSGSGGGAHIAAWHAQGRTMPIAITLGGPPALTWCAGASLPDEVSELEFTSYLTKQPVSVAQCRHSDLLVPSSSEIVIEGHLIPGEEQIEGPFGNHTGYYSSATPAPVIRVKSVHMRESAVYPCTVVGPPPMENMYLAQAVERMMLPLLQHDYPWIKDIHMPLEGIYHRAALVSVDAPDIPVMEIGQMLRLTRLLRNSRLIILLDKCCDLRKAANVYWRLVNAGPWEHSVLIEADQMTIDARAGSRGAAVHTSRNTLHNVIKRWQSFSLGDVHRRP
ncbi:MAG: UbiD family decarboxylase [Desulfuromonadales bacterium]